MGTLTINNCEFYNNYAHDGGAIAADKEAITILTGTNIFKDNNVWQDGGAIANIGGSELYITGKNTFEGNVVRLLENKTLPSLLLPKIRRNKFIEIIPISQGCLGSCTYCKTKQARGKLISYPTKQIVEACKRAWENNAKELWITSEDTAVYGRDIGTNLPTLMIEILKYVPKDVMIRIGLADRKSVV